MIRNAKPNYLLKLQSYIVDKSIPPGKWWRIAKSVINNKNKNDTDFPLEINGDLKYHPVEKCESLNSYFTSISTTNKTIDDVPLDIPPFPPRGIKYYYH